MNRLGVRLAGGNNARDGWQLQREFDVETAGPCVAHFVKTNLEVSDGREVSGGSSGFE